MNLLTYQLPSYFLELLRSFSDVMIVIAALDEEEGIGSTLRELKDVLVDPCFLVVDGNSVFWRCQSIDIEDGALGA